MDFEVAGAFIDDSRSEFFAKERVLGCRLRKLCNWHRLLLATIKSPYVNKGPVTLQDLRIAVGICRTGPFRSRTKKPWLVPTWIYLRAFWWAFRPARFKGGRNLFKELLTKQNDRFLEFCGSYLQDPEYTIIPRRFKGRNEFPDTSRGKFDDVIESIGELINWGISEKRAWSMPIGQARVYRIMARRAAGLDVDIVDEGEREFRNAMRKAQQEEEGEKKHTNGSA